MSPTTTADLVTLLADTDVLVWKYEIQKKIGPFITLDAGVFVDYQQGDRTFTLTLSLSVNGHGISKTFPLPGNLSVATPPLLGCSLGVNIHNFAYGNDMLSFDVSVFASTPLGTIDLYTEHVTKRVPTEAELAELYAPVASVDELKLRLTALA